LFEGKKVNLRVAANEGFPPFEERLSNLEFSREPSPFRQMSKSKTERILEDPYEMKSYAIEKKDGTKVGLIFHFHVLHPAYEQLEVGYDLAPSERGKGYCAEAMKLVVDHLFQSGDTMRVQACTAVTNLASRKVLEKAGFKKERKMRKYVFFRGKLRDAYYYRILRQDWKKPRILTRAS
jgi:RimJ/RimL family protein N-acetyltransferase